MEEIQKYLYWCIDNIQPITLDYQIKIYGNHGYIPSGYTSMKNMPSVEQWKNLNIGLPRV